MSEIQSGDIFVYNIGTIKYPHFVRVESVDSGGSVRARMLDTEKYPANGSSGTMTPCINKPIGGSFSCRVEKTFDGRICLEIDGNYVAYRWNGEPWRYEN